MAPVTLWNVYFVVELIVAAALIAGLVWVYRRVTRRYRDQRKRLNAHRSCRGLSGAPDHSGPCSKIGSRMAATRAI